MIVVLWPPLGQTVCSFFLVTVPVGEKARLISFSPGTVYVTATYYLSGSP